MSDTTPVTPTKSLASKLAEVMAAVERIPKNGRNTFHNYSYATEADIVAAIRQELASRHIILIPSTGVYVREAVGEKGSFLTTLQMEFEFLDGETGQSIVRRWIGCGSDKDDKGLYKAMTGGEKYFLLKCFLVPTGDDPEADKGKEDASQERRPTQGRARGSDTTPSVRPASPVSKPEPLSAGELKAAPANDQPTTASVLARARELGWKDAEVSSHVRKHHGKGLSQLTPDELAAVAATIETGEVPSHATH